MSGSPRLGVDYALVLLAAVVFSALLSYSYGALLPTNADGLLSLLFGRGAVLAFESYASTLDAALVALELFVFYELGKRLDFKSQYWKLSAISLAGSLIGNLPGFFESVSYQSGSGWQMGFGYVASFGLAEPSSILDLLTAAVGVFMIPVAGLALSHVFERRDVAGSPGRRASSIFSSEISIVSFAIVVLALPVADIANILISRAYPHPFVPGIAPSPWVDLAGGLVGFIVYPGLFLTAFYFLGKRLVSGSIPVKEFLESVFVSSVAGLLIGSFLNVLVANPSSLGRFLAAGDLAKLAVFVAAAGVSVSALALGAASLGLATRLAARHEVSASSELPVSPPGYRLARAASAKRNRQIESTIRMGDYFPLT